MSSKKIDKNKEFFFHCFNCEKIISRTYFLKNWMCGCGQKNKYSKSNEEKTHHHIITKTLYPDKVESKKELESKKAKKIVSKNSSNFSFVNELKERNKDKESFKIYFEEVISYDDVVFEKIEELQLYPPLEKTITGKVNFSGIFEYQKKTFEKIIAGKNIAVTAPTGTGKTLSFILPIIQKIINEGSYGKLHAIIITPIKALTSDQFEQIKRYTDLTDVSVGILTGDVSPEDKDRIIANPPEILLTNFDSVYTHLYHNTRFASLFSNFKVLVIDEIHYYSGIHGSNIHHVIASLKKMNDNLQLIGASATIDNLEQFSQKLFDTRDIEIIKSNQKNGLTEFLMIAPVGVSFTTLLMNFCKELKEQNKQFLIFWDSKTGVEKFAWRAEKNHIKIEPHRAGLKAWERKEIESKLKSRKLDGLICTPTLELGIDIGSIEVVFSILVPWSKFKQRMGRAGRRDTPGYGFLILGDDPVSEWFKKHPLDFKNEHIVHINPKNKRVSKFMIPFRVLNTNKIKGNFVKKDEKLFLENKHVFKQNELFIEKNDHIEPNRGNIEHHLRKYNIRGMGEDVTIFQKPFKEFKEKYELKHKIGSETTPLAYQRFHVDAIYIHRKQLFKVIKTHLHPNEEDVERYVIVEPVKDIKYYTRPTVDKDPKIPNDSNTTEKIVGGINIKLTDLKIDKTIQGYKKFSIFDDTPVEEESISLKGEEFTFHTRGIVFEIPIEEKDCSEIFEEHHLGVKEDTSFKIKSEVLDGLHVIEHILQHAGVTIANISHENLDGIYENTIEKTKFKKIYIFDDSGDGESGAVEAIFYNIEEVIRRAFEMLSQCKGPENKTCEEPNGCSKCTFLMLKCSQYNENLYKPSALIKLEKIVYSMFKSELEYFEHKKWDDIKVAKKFLLELEKKYTRIIKSTAEKINEVKYIIDE